MILEILADLETVQVEPHYLADEYDPAVEATKGYVYVGQLSEHLSKLGTLLDGQKKIHQQEMKAFEDRQREALESTSMPIGEKRRIIEGELPDRLLVLTKQKIAINIGNTSFGKASFSIHQSDCIQGNKEGLIYETYMIRVEEIYKYIFDICTRNSFSLKAFLSLFFTQ